MADGNACDECSAQIALEPIMIPREHREIIDEMLEKAGSASQGHYRQVVRHEQDCKHKLQEAAEQAAHMADSAAWAADLIASLERKAPKDKSLSGLASMAIHEIAAGRLKKEDDDADK